MGIIVIINIGNYDKPTNGYYKNDAIVNTVIIKIN